MFNITRKSPLGRNGSYVYIARPHMAAAGDVPSCLSFRTDLVYVSSGHLNNNIRPPLYYITSTLNLHEGFDLKKKKYYITFFRYGNQLFFIEEA